MQPIQILDMREQDFTLDKHGFQLVAHQSADKTFDDDERVKAKVYEETSKLLKNVCVRSRPCTAVT